MPNSFLVLFLCKQQQICTRIAAAFFPFYFMVCFVRAQLSHLRSFYLSFSKERKNCFALLKKCVCFMQFRLLSIYCAAFSHSKQSALRFVPIKLIIYIFTLKKNKWNEIVGICVCTSVSICTVFLSHHTYLIRTKNFAVAQDSMEFKCCCAVNWLISLSFILSTRCDWINV